MVNTNQTWSDRKSLLAQLEKLWDKGTLLRERLEPGNLFPRRLTFKSPDSKALGSDFDAVRRWIADIEQLTGFRVVWKTVHHRIIGENSVPSEVWVDTLESAVSLLNRKKKLHCFDELVATTRDRNPELIGWIGQYPLKALSLADAWPKLLDFVRWRKQHPSPAIYLRQVSLPGIDSKFIEQNRGVLAALLDLSLHPEQISSESTGVRQFERRYGFRNKPATVRFRLLDPELALLPGSDGDISLTASDFQALYHDSEFASRIRRVFITENEINFLAFPPQPRSLVIFGAGYGFEALAQADWLTRIAVVYWGDIDTHGFAILNQLRAKFPHVQSLLMDQGTLLTHREFWGHEKKPEGRALLRLTPQEQEIYRALLANTYAEHLRLEQERVRYDDLLAALCRLDEV
jgi:hypothetical protein